MPVHLYGQSADMDPLMEIARRYRLEGDRGCRAGHRHRIQERRACRLDRRHRLLFVLSEQESGRLRRRRACAPPTIRNWPSACGCCACMAASRSISTRVIGGNFRIDELQAAVLRVKLKYLDGWTARRGSATPRTTMRRLPRPGLGSKLRHAARDAAAAGIFSINTWCACRIATRCRQCLDRARHRHRDLLSGAAAPAAVLRLPGLSRRRLSRSPSAPPRETLALPIYPELTEAQLAHVVATHRRVLRLAGPRRGLSSS